MGAGDTIRMIREKEGLSQRELGNISGISAQSVCNYEHGRNDPTTAVFRQLLEAMGYELVVRKKKETQ